MIPARALAGLVLLAGVPSAGAVPLAWAPGASVVAASEFLGVTAAGFIDAWYMWPGVGPPGTWPACTADEVPWSITLEVLAGAPTDEALLWSGRYETAPAAFGRPATLATTSMGGCTPPMFGVQGATRTTSVPYRVEARCLAPDGCWPPAPGDAGR